MTATKLALVGENRWGQRVSMRMYRDKSGDLCVGLRSGSLRAKFVPYRDYASRALSYSYIIERK